MKLFCLQEFADALMEVKKAIDEIYQSVTLKQVLGTLLSIGNFLNSTQVRKSSLPSLFLNAPSRPLQHTPSFPMFFSPSF